MHHGPQGVYTPGAPASGQGQHGSEESGLDQQDDLGLDQQDDANFDGLQDAIAADTQHQISWPVAVLPDGRELHFTFEVTEAADMRRDQKQFAFAGIRFARFQDGFHLVGWCTHSKCRDSNSHAAQILSDSNFTEQTCAAFFQGQPSVCAEAAKVEQAWGGWSGDRLPELRATLLETMAAGELQAQTLRSHSFNYTTSISARAVQPQPDEFSSWAVLLPHSNGAGHFCTSCAKSHTCQHMLAMRLTGGSGHQTLSAADFEHKLREDFDLQAGTLPTDAPGARRTSQIEAVLVLQASAS